MMKRRFYRRQDGFTILEMMIAAAVFSVILLVAAAGILSFTNAYYKGVTSTTTQQATRNILNDITRNIQLSSGVRIDPGSVGSICINSSLQYAYRLGGPVVGPDNDHALVKDSNSTCTGTSVLSANLNTNQQEMLGEHMRLAVLDVVPVAGGGAYSVHVRVIYGDDYDLLTFKGTALTSEPTPAWWLTNGGEVECRSTVGSQFCAVSDLKTTVQVRL